MSQDPARQPLFPMRCAGNMLVHFAVLGVDAFPPHRRGLILVMGKASSGLRPELVVMDAPDDSYPRAWLEKQGLGADAGRILAAAEAVGCKFQNQAREMQPYA